MGKKSMAPSPSRRACAISSGCSSTSPVIARVTQRTPGHRPEPAYGPVGRATRWPGAGDAGGDGAATVDSLVVAGIAGAAAFDAGGAASDAELLGADLVGAVVAGAGVAGAGATGAVAKDADDLPGAVPLSPPPAQAASNIAADPPANPRIHDRRAERRRDCRIGCRSGP